MRVTVTHRWRRLSAVVQLMLFAFSASTSLLPCAKDMVTATAELVQVEQHAAPVSHASHAAHASDGTSHNASHGASQQDATEPASPAHHSPDSHTACPWVVGCTGMVQFAIESTWHSVETAPVMSAPDGEVLRAVNAERDVESPPPRA
jgi:hypothetical protein